MILRQTISALAVCAVLLSTAVAKTPQVTAIASYPHGTFLENMSVSPAGRLLFTSYLDRKILSWPGRGAPTLFVQLDVHPVAVLSRARDTIVTAHGQSFTDGAAFTSTNQFLVLDPQGVVKKRIPAPNAMFLNGIVELDRNTILAADSLAGKLWALSPSTGVVREWSERLHSSLGFKSPAALEVNLIQTQAAIAA